MCRTLAAGMALAVLICFVRPLCAIVAHSPADRVPVDRLIVNTGKFVKAHLDAGVGS